jgi:hypothetical protein
LILQCTSYWMHWPTSSSHGQKYEFAINLTKVNLKILVFLMILRLLILLLIVWEFEKDQGQHKRKKSIARLIKGIPLGGHHKMDHVGLDSNKKLYAWLGVWLWLFFKVLFVSKCIKIMFFYFFKKLFLRSAHQNNLKQKKLIFSKNQNWIFWEHGLYRVPKRWSTF